MSQVSEYNGQFLGLKDHSLFHQASYVHGEWLQAASGKTFEVTDPGTGQVWATCPDNSHEDVGRAIQSSHRGFLQHLALTARNRAHLLMEWHRLVKEARDDLAKDWETLV